MDRHVKKRIYSSLHGSIHRAKKFNVPYEHIDPFQILKQLKRQKTKCVYCGKDILFDFSLDHIYPLSLGGTHTLDNLQLTCRPCNTRKNANPEYEHYVPPVYYDHPVDPRDDEEIVPGPW